MERQLDLFDTDPLADAVRRIAPDEHAEIVYAPARRRLFSWKRDEDRGTLTVRVGPEFRRAPAEVAEAIARIVTRRRMPRELRSRLYFEVRAWLAGEAPDGPTVGRVVPPAGRHVDLRPVLESVRTRRLDRPIPARIGWTGEPARRLMGRYERGFPEGLVVINRLLDSPISPPWYLDFLVYHELLHAAFPPRPGAGKILVHPPEFRRAERRHEDISRTKAFERWACGDGYPTLLAGVGEGASLPKKFR